MMRKILILFVILLSTPALGWLIQKPGYIGPGDIVAFTAWYGLRGYSSSIAAGGTTPMVRVRNQGSSEKCDILVAQNGGVGLTTNCTAGGAGQTAATWCVGGCRVENWYDQTNNNACSGASCDLVNTAITGNLNFTPGSPTIPANTFIVTPGGNVNATSANNFTPSTSTLSLDVVGKRTNIFTQLSHMLEAVGSNNSLQANTVADQWVLTGGASGTVVKAATDVVWHTGAGVLNGASSVLTIDGADTTGTATASTAAAKPASRVPAVLGSIFQVRELGFINNYALSSGERISLDAQQRTYWNF